MIFCFHRWVYDWLPAKNSRYCERCGKTQKGHIQYECWHNHVFSEPEFLSIFGYEMPQVVRAHGERISNVAVYSSHWLTTQLNGNHIKSILGPSKMRARSEYGEKGE